MGRINIFKFDKLSSTTVIILSIYHDLIYEDENEAVIPTLFKFF